MEPSDSFSENVKRFDLEFTGTLIGLLQRINDKAFNNSSDKFINLANRINYNSFYNQQMEFLCAKDSMRVSNNVPHRVSGGGLVEKGGTSSASKH